jgi:hypothetical protein
VNSCEHLTSKTARFEHIGEFRQNSLACVAKRSDECDPRGHYRARRSKMKTFTIDAENNITTHASSEGAEAAAGTEHFSSAAELSALAANWPGERLVEIWNSLSGAIAVKKFKDRKTAVSRIWKAIENLGEPETAKKATPAPRKPHVAPAKAKATKKATKGKGAPKGKEKPKGMRGGSKTAEVLEMIKRPKGATLAEIMKFTGWQPHSVRGFVSGTLGKKMGLTVESAKREDGERVYSIER